ncbi:MAG: BON domain-containing protein [Acidobacteriota bacterium]|nr:BON domain-containing protein [Acidobacteriota bacterium]
MNHSVKSFGRALALAGLMTGGLALVPASAQDTNTSAKPDNTKVNKRDRPPSAVTADQQKMNGGDREVTRKIRRAVYADKSLSTYAHNVKIVTVDGMVTLKGPVRSEEEKKTVESKATEIAGAGKVTNEISIKSGTAGTGRHKKAATM